MSENDPGSARDGNSDDVKIIGNLEVCHIPKGRHTVREVRVIGQQGLATHGASTGNHPVITPDSSRKVVRIAESLQPQKLEVFQKGSSDGGPRVASIGGTPGFRLLVEDIKLGGKPVSMRFEECIDTLRITAQAGEIRFRQGTGLASRCRPETEDALLAIQF